MKLQEIGRANLLASPFSAEWAFAGCLTLPHREASAKERRNPLGHKRTIHHHPVRQPLLGALRWGRPHLCLCLQGRSPRSEATDRRAGCPNPTGGSRLKNAHLRIGQLEFTKWTQGKGTRFRVSLDRLIAEPASSQGATAPAHLISVFGNDSEIAAIVAAVSCQESFRIEAPSVPEMRITLGDEARQFRGSFVLPGRRKQPFRHLVALSEALAHSRARPASNCPESSSWTVIRPLCCFVSQPRSVCLPCQNGHPLLFPNCNVSAGWKV